MIIEVSIIITIIIVIVVCIYSKNLKGDNICQMTIASMTSCYYHLNWVRQ